MSAALGARIIKIGRCRQAGMLCEFHCVDGAMADPAAHGHAQNLG